MEEKIKLRVGQVWESKTGLDKYCIGAINIEQRKVWMNGVIDMVNPIWTWEYLDENYEMIEGWQI